MGEAIFNPETFNSVAQLFRQSVNSELGEAVRWEVGMDCNYLGADSAVAGILLNISLF